MAEKVDAPIEEQERLAKEIVRYATQIDGPLAATFATLAQTYRAE
jgi:hypothetical protein